MEGKNVRGKEKREMLKRQKVRRVHHDVFDDGLKNYLLGMPIGKQFEIC